MSSNYPKRILILGGGFAGVYTARYLEQLLRPEEASITLINRENYWVYQPMLPDCWLTSSSAGLCAGRSNCSPGQPKETWPRPMRPVIFSAITVSER
jgi:cation diffusion facilitator CzcD-associated flavoprotein CzcO